MFFSPELLSRRDSGFGLLWLAATLGAKSSFSKLPKRSVMTANISQLCGLIADPQEPLALRLSSNLMIGVARVYKVKQEILLTDVTTCFNMLKRAFQDAYVAGSTSAQLQMAQPSVRPDTVTIAANPTAVYALDFDNIFGDWDERTGNKEDEEVDSDDDFGVKKKGKKKGKAKASSIPQAEQPRAEHHTLQEHNGFMFTSSFDVSFGAGGFGGPISSSQVRGYGLDDDFLEGLDIAADIGAELARELGEGWGAPPEHLISEDVGPLTALELDLGPSMDMNVDFQFENNIAPVNEMEQASQHESSAVRKRVSTVLRAHEAIVAELHKSLTEVDHDILQPDGSIILPLSPVGTPPTQAEAEAVGGRKPKRVRLMLDPRTELTHAELERARESYLAGQSQLRQELAQKKAEKEAMKMLEELAWGAPRGINAPALVQFWEEIFELQVEARSGQPRDNAKKSPRKRRRLAQDDPMTGAAIADEWNHDAFDGRMDVDMNLGIGEDFANQNEQYELDLNTRLRSSEEPGQARRGSSRPPSLLGSNFGLGTKQPDSGSQRSNMFPWDNAGGVSSSISGVAFEAGGSDRLSLGRVDTRLRRSSSLARGSIGVPESPASFIPSGSQFEPEAFEFTVPPEDASRIETQASDMSMITLEKNSSNFLEYLKIQMNALPTGTTSLAFDDVVPKDTSTRHVAAAAFYHCLVLSTKDLISIGQEEPFSVVRLAVK